MPWDEPFNPLKEFCKAYNETFVRINHRGKKTVVQVLGRESETIPGLGVHLYEKPGVKKIFKSSVKSSDSSLLRVFNRSMGVFKVKFDPRSLRIDTSYPDPGYFLHHGRLLSFIRTSRRQWRKGMCADTCVINEVGHPRWIPVNDDILESAFAPRVGVGLSDAIGWLGTKDLCAVPMTNHWGLSLSIREKHPHEYALWYKTVPVAWVIDDVIELFHSVIRQEAEDFIRSNKSLDTAQWQLK